MNVTVPATIRSLPDPGGRFGLCWGDPPADAEIQSWHVVRCDYPIGPPQAGALLTGGLDLMTTRWDLHPSARAVVEDTGVRGKHYTVIGLDARGQVYFPDDLALDPEAGGTALSGAKAHKGWMPHRVKKDRYSGMF